jgi:Raf kinase inhibitor-like YbhB/YbcL family protein
MNNTATVYAAAFACALFATSAMALPDALRVELAAGTLHGHELPTANASCVRSAAGSAPGANRSLAVKWTIGPAGTRSYALTMVDLDVPADLSTLNKAGTVIAADAPRMEFVHWVLADIPKNVTALAETADGDGQPQGGLPLERTSHGLRGQNGFAAFMKDGPYGGYMGPCPPWNDERVHRYRVTVYALDVDSLGISGAFTRADLLKSAQGHVLATGSAEVDYSVNSAAKN